MEHLRDLVIDGEPQIVTNARKLIIDSFSDLAFDPEPHIYTFPDGTTLPSVSAITHQFEPHKDFDVIAENYAKKNGHTAEYWQLKWKHNNLIATTTGSLVHEYGESLGWLWSGHPENITQDCKSKYDKEHKWLIPTRKKEEAILQFHKDLHPDLHLVLPETKVYTGKFTKNSLVTPHKLKQEYCGTFDILYYYDCKENPSRSGFVLMDYKTNGSLQSDFARSNGRMALAPFNNMYDESLTYYNLQLSAYQIPLENIGLKVIARRIIWLKDDGTYEVIPATNYTSTLRQIL